MNTLTTALIVYKIVTVYNDIRGFSNSGNSGNSGYGTGQRDLYPLISILIESGLVTFVGQLAQSIMYMAAPDAFPLVGGVVVMLYVRAFLFDFGVPNIHTSCSQQGISTTVVLVRVEMGITYDHNTSKVVHSTNSRRPIPLAPFTSKLNQSITIDVEGHVSDYSYDMRAESKLSPN